ACRLSSLPPSRAPLRGHSHPGDDHMRNNPAWAAVLIVALALTGPIAGHASEIPVSSSAASPSAADATAPATPDIPPAAAASPAPDTTTSWRAALENTRAAYQAAWSSRQSGQFDVAVSICDRALARLVPLMALNPDAGVRRELTDLQSRIAGLRDAAHKDLESANSAKASGNEADETTLNAPAAESIDPQWNDQVQHWVEFFTGAG